MIAQNKKNQFPIDIQTLYRNARRTNKSNWAKEDLKKITINVAKIGIFLLKNAELNIISLIVVQ